jgi:hypothetical protein
MTNRSFFTERINNPSKEGEHASLAYKDRVFYSYDDKIGRREGRKLFVSDNPSTLTTEGHIEMLSNIARFRGLEVITKRL